MSPKVIRYLQRFFWFLGCALLVSATVGIASEIYFYTNSVTPDLSPREDFQFLRQSQLLFSSIGQAFFSFLLSSVFGMVFHRDVVRADQTEKFLKLTCIGFLGDGLLGVIRWVVIGTFVIPGIPDLSGWGLYSIFSYALSIFPHLVSFVYAIAIYVLYRHFSQLVTFEAEVV